MSFNILVFENADNGRQEFVHKRQIVRFYETTEPGVTALRLTSGEVFHVKNATQEILSWLDEEDYFPINSKAEGMVVLMVNHVVRMATTKSGNATVVRMTNGERFTALNITAAQLRTWFGD